jgi:hypothetical protein
VSAFVRAVTGGNRRGGFREGPAKGPRGAIVFCVMYNSPSSPGSRVGNSGPSCPLYLLQWLVERYIRPLTVTTSWRPSFSLPPSLRRVVVVDGGGGGGGGGGAATLSFLSFLSSPSRLSLLSARASFRSSLFFPSLVNFACQGALCSRGRDSRILHVPSERSNNVARL